MYIYIYIRTFISVEYLWHNISRRISTEERDSVSLDLWEGNSTGQIRCRPAEKSGAHQRESSTIFFWMGGCCPFAIDFCGGKMYVLGTSTNLDLWVYDTVWVTRIGHQHGYYIPWVQGSLQRFPFFQVATGRATEHPKLSTFKLSIDVSRFSTWFQWLEMLNIQLFNQLVGSQFGNSYLGGGRIFTRIFLGRTSPILTFAYFSKGLVSSTTN